MLTIQALAKLSGVSTRTLRYYDEIGLLTPSAYSEAGYRLYTQREIDILQHILFYRALDVRLEEIKQIIYNDKFNVQQALQSHRTQLMHKQQQIQKLIKTLDTMLGGVNMSNTDKFEAFKSKKIKENEAQYGQEIRAKYGEKAVAEANQNFMGLSEEAYHKAQEIEQRLFLLLQQRGDQRSIANLHKEWLCYFMPQYSEDLHKGIVTGYLADDRFIKYYDTKAGEGATQYLVEAVCQ
ncbi:MerR family transcriptional regulator [Lysinibacillus alkalisoli]|uniref:MerR family transcriptional regulator n=1 Tax=Lysinibacillus alkalisoli TaxID=1911548 RepID=A0A917G998_9BACI|nr:MerR family transcriptional regulator [Lysinibacillus alkalisoli]GGG30522.1 MerR family transcriptional regulator [Lysinibacillus alkalisoli]